MHLEVALGLGLGEIGVTREELTRRPYPVLAEDRLHRVDRGTLEADRKVAIGALAVGFVLPLVDDAVAAHERGLAVDHQDLAMVALVEDPDEAQFQGMETSELHPGRHELLADT